MYVDNTKMYIKPWDKLMMKNRVTCQNINLTFKSINLAMK